MLGKIVKIDSNEDLQTTKNKKQAIGKATRNIQAGEFLKCQCAFIDGQFVIVGIEGVELTKPVLFSTLEKP